ncbi:hypothetical protein M8C21_001003, partial [Ambrosia artemisiifolia]
SFVGLFGIGFVVNYGRIANNLLPPFQVPKFLKSSDIYRVKIYDAEPEVLQASAGTDIKIIIGLENIYLQRMCDPQQAKTWIQQNVQPFLLQTKITCINVGNKVLGGGDSQLESYLLPAMNTMHGALVNLGSSKEVYITTSHSFQIIPTFFSPFQGAFKEDMVQYMKPILDFHAQVKSPFSLTCTLILCTKVIKTTISWNVVYTVLEALESTNLEVKISETGWPSKGDENKAGYKKGKVLQPDLQTRLTSIFLLFLTRTKRTAQLQR